MAEILGTVKLTGVISPTDTNDVYAVFDTQYGKSDKHVVGAGAGDVDNRDAIIESRRHWGMLCHIQGGTLGVGVTKTYQLVYGTSSTTITDNGNWVEVTGLFGGGGGHDIYSQDSAVGAQSILNFAAPLKAVDDTVDRIDVSLEVGQANSFLYSTGVDAWEETVGMQWDNTEKTFTIISKNDQTTDGTKLSFPDGGSEDPISGEAFVVETPTYSSPIHRLTQDSLIRLGLFSGGDSTERNLIAIGYKTAKNAEASHARSIYIGSRAGEFSASADNTRNVVIGHNAARYFNPTAAGSGRNIVIGDSAGIGGSDSVAATYTTQVIIGESAASSLLTGEGNFFLGRNVAQGIQDGNRNVAIGTAALGSDTGATGINDNIAIGNNAMGSTSSTATSKLRNIAIGTSALINLDGGERNFAAGYTAGNKLTSGDRNVFLGYGVASDATNGTTTGSDNIIIGYDLNAPSATRDDYMSVGDVVFGELSGTSNNPFAYFQMVDINGLNDADTDVSAFMEDVTDRWTIYRDNTDVYLRYYNGASWIDVQVASAGGGAVTSVTSTTQDQLTASPTTGAVNLAIVTAPVADLGTALATGDQIYDFVTGLGYIDTETDPVFTASEAAGISAGDITNWNNAFSWGDHGAAGYAKQLSDLSDVDNSLMAADKRVLMYDGLVDNQWEAITLELNHISDVSAMAIEVNFLDWSAQGSPASSYYLKSNGSGLAWQQPKLIHNSDVFGSMAPNDLDIFAYDNGNSRWDAMSATDLGLLGNFLADGFFFVGDVSNEATATDPATIDVTIFNLIDLDSGDEIDLTTATDGDFVRLNGTTWESHTLVFGDIDWSPDTEAEHDIPYYDGTGWILQDRREHDYGYIWRIVNANYGMNVSITDAEYQFMGPNAQQSVLAIDINNGDIISRDGKIKRVDVYETNNNLYGIGTGYSAETFQPIFAFDDTDVQGATEWATGIFHHEPNTIGLGANGHIGMHFSINHVTFGRTNFANTSANYDANDGVGYTNGDGSVSSMVNKMQFITNFEQAFSIAGYGADPHVGTANFTGTLQMFRNAHVTRGKGIIFSDINSFGGSWKRWFNNNNTGGGRWEVRYGIAGAAGAFGSLGDIGVNDTISYIHQTDPLVGFKDLTAAPSNNPPAGFYGLYFKNGDLYKINSSGTETQISGGAGVTLGAATRIPYMNDAGTDFLYSGNFVFQDSTPGPVRFGVIGNVYGTSMDLGGSAPGVINLYDLSPGPILGRIQFTDANTIDGSPDLYAQLGASQRVAYNDTDAGDGTLAFYVMTDLGGSVALPPTGDAKYIGLNETNHAGMVGIYKPLAIVDGSFHVEIVAPTLSGSYTLTLPTDDGTSGYVLSTDGSGVLSWVANAGGGLSVGTDYQIPHMNTSDDDFLYTDEFRFNPTTGTLFLNSELEFTGANTENLITIPTGDLQALRVTDGTDYYIQISSNSGAPNNTKTIQIGEADVRTDLFEQAWYGMVTIYADPFELIGSSGIDAEFIIGSGNDSATGQECTLKIRGYQYNTPDFDPVDILTITSKGQGQGDVEADLNGVTRLYDPTDTTKKALFDMSGITTATTRTFTMPDVDSDILPATLDSLADAHFMIYDNAAGVFENHIISGDGTIDKDGVLNIEDTVHGFTVQQYFAASALDTSPSTSNSIAWDVETDQVFIIELNENTTLAVPDNPQRGGTYIIVVSQPGSGGPYTLGFNSIYKFPGGTAPTITASAGAKDVLTFVYDGSQMLCVAAQNFS